MFLDNAIQPVMGERLSHILRGLIDHPAIETAVLATDDGLAVDVTAESSTQLAAVTGFILAASNQASAMLSQPKAEEIMITLPNQSFLLCHIFTVRDIQLILTVLFREQTAYKRLIAQTIRDIQQTVEK